MRFNPANPLWFNRDRFVLSNGHACALQYIMLHLTGYKEFSMDELKRFRQVDSKTPGHPESHLVHGGIEVTTGPLGQGVSNAVGLAIAEAHLAATFNKPGYDLINNYTYVFVGDGCLQEGISAEAASLAGHLGLGKLIVFYDDNNVTIDGFTELSFTEDVGKRFEAYGWHVSSVHDGNHDLGAIEKAIEEAKKVTDKPSLIKVKTIIGFGSAKQGTEKVHGSPLGADDVAAVKKKFGFNPEQFFVIPHEVEAAYSKYGSRGQEFEGQWNDLLKKYSAQFPELGNELHRRIAGKFPENWKSSLPTFKPEDAPKATRQYSESVIGPLSTVLPELFGGAADLNPSTLTYIKSSKDFQKNSYDGRNIRFGVREHAMAAICNGIAAYGGSVPYCSTFLNFIGYAMGAVRLSAISMFGVIYVMTHDSIGLGEDGPTHQPIESLPMLRALPNLLLIRPADGNETSGAYAVAVENRNRPSVLALTRQAVPNLKGTSIDGVYKGAYVLADHSDSGKLDIVLTASGSEVHLIVQAAEKLKELGVKARVVSFPSFELFDSQSDDYRLSVFPDGVPVLAVEAAAAFGWKEYAHASVAMHGFGTSGPAKDVFVKYGFTVDNIVKKSQVLIGFYANQKPISLVRRPF